MTLNITSIGRLEMKRVLIVGSFATVLFTLAAVFMPGGTQRESSLADRLLGCLHRESYHCWTELIAGYILLRTPIDSNRNYYFRSQELAGSLVRTGLDQGVVSYLLDVAGALPDRASATLAAVARLYVEGSRFGEAKAIAARFGDEVGFPQLEAGELWSVLNTASRSERHLLFSRYESRLARTDAEDMAALIMSGNGAEDQVWIRAANWNDLVRENLPDMRWPPAFLGQRYDSIVEDLLRLDGDLQPSREHCQGVSHTPGRSELLRPTWRGEALLDLPGSRLLDADDWRKIGTPEFQIFVALRGHNHHLTKAVDAEVSWHRYYVGRLTRILREVHFDLATSARRQAASISATLTGARETLDERKVRNPLESVVALVEVASALISNSKFDAAAFSTAADTFDLLLTLVETGDSVQGDLWSMISSVGDDYRTLAAVFSYRLARNGHYAIPIMYIALLPHSELLLKTRMASCTVLGLIERGDLPTALRATHWFSSKTTEGLRENELEATGGQGCLGNPIYEETCAFISGAVEEMESGSAQFDATYRRLWRLRKADDDRRDIERYLLARIGDAIRQLRLTEERRHALIRAIETSFRSSSAAIADRAARRLRVVEPTTNRKEVIDGGDGISAAGVMIGHSWANDTEYRHDFAALLVRNQELDRFGDLMSRLTDSEIESMVASILPAAVGAMRSVR